MTEIHREYWVGEQCPVCQKSLIQKGRGVTCPDQHFYTRYAYARFATHLEVFVEFMFDKHVVVFLPDGKVSFFNLSDGSEIFHMDSNMLTIEIIFSLEKANEFYQNYQIMK